MEHAIFTFTLCASLLNVAKIISVMTGHTLSLPHYGWLNPSSWFIFYPAFLHQTWFWSERLFA